MTAEGDEFLGALGTLGETREHTDLVESSLLGKDCDMSVETGAAWKKHKQLAFRPNKVASCRGMTNAPPDMVKSRYGGELMG